MILIRRAALVAALASSAARAGGVDFDEFQTKAAYLYNFAKFVSWPAATFSGRQEPVTVCILGQDPLGMALMHLVQGKTVDGRPLAVRVLPDAREVGKCQILFIAASEKKRVWLLLDQLAGTSILTVGEIDEFTAVGGMVNLKRSGAGVRIQIALDAVEHARLSISSRLLSMAEIVRK